MQLPNIWLWDMVDEFLYQFQVGRAWGGGGAAGSVCVGGGMTRTGGDRGASLVQCSLRGTGWAGGRADYYVYASAVEP